MNLNDGSDLVCFKCVLIYLKLVIVEYVDRYVWKLWNRCQKQGVGGLLQFGPQIGKFSYCLQDRDTHVIYFEVWLPSLRSRHPPSIF